MKVTDVVSRQGLLGSLLEEPLSLVRGVRPSSEFTEMHRFAQAIAVAQDYANGAESYDHFAGSLLVPQIVALGARWEVLEKFPVP